MTTSGREHAQAIVRAAIVAGTGAIVLLLLGSLLYGLVGSPADIVAVLGVGFVATLALARAPMPTFAASVRPATGIVTLTLLGIAAAHAVDQVMVRHQPVDAEALVKLFWSVIFTSWWLIPGTALVLAMIGRLQTPQSDTEGTAS